MKPQLLLAFLLALAIHAHARNFPSGDHEHDKALLDTIIRNIYRRPAKSPPPAPSKAPPIITLTLESSDNCNYHDTAAGETNNNINKKYISCKIRSPPPPPKAVKKLEREGPSPPPPPAGAPGTGHLIPITLCLPGTPCASSHHDTSKSSF